MRRRYLQRLALSVAAVLFGSLLVFAATEALPGDAATAKLGRVTTPESLRLLRAELGLDRPFFTRYFEWLGRAVRGDLGVSSSSQRSVWTVIGPAVANSVQLAVAAIILTIPVALVLGLVSGLRRGGWFDGAIGGVTLIAVSLPEFVLGLFLAASLGITWHVLPPTSLMPRGMTTAERLEQLVLPAVSVAGVTIGYILRMTRAATIEVLDSEYVRAARLRGIGGWQLLSRHVARNALIPTVNVIGNQIAWMLGGMIGVELIFSFPGVGMQLVNAVIARDATLIAGLSLLISTTYIVVNLGADLVALWLNPRLRAGRR